MGSVTGLSPKLGVVARFLQLYLRSGARGRTRCTFALAHRLKSLQSVPIAVHGEYVFVNLEDGPSHLLLAGSPWADPPWETDEQELMRRLLRSGDVAFDIGAHIGLHTVLLAQLVGPAGAVHAFEPNPRRVAALAATLDRLPRAQLHAVALGDRVAEAPLFVPHDESMASLADWTDGRAGGIEVRACAVRPLDDLVRAGEAPLPYFIKCDVEGAELRVFMGARWVLDRPDAPFIL
jgi:FkbM family methyltransferase